MNFFNRLFNKTNQAEKNAISVSEVIIDNENKESKKSFEKTKELFTISLNLYNLMSCQCAFPRYQQIISIDCADTGNSYKCYDTDLLIDLSKPFFNMVKSELKDENVNETWICKTCGSSYEYGWSDFSIHVERQKLRLTDLKAELTGKSIIQPVPLYLGLAGHSYPSRNLMEGVDFAAFKKYMTEN
jgi:hypothetical protein